MHTVGPVYKLYHLHLLKSIEHRSGVSLITDFLDNTAPERTLRIRPAFAGMTTRGRFPASGLPGHTKFAVIASDWRERGNLGVYRVLENQIARASGSPSLQQAGTSLRSSQRRQRDRSCGGMFC
jgi:hypothetical protein